MNFITNFTSNIVNNGVFEKIGKKIVENKTLIMGISGIVTTAVGGVMMANAGYKHCDLDLYHAWNEEETSGKEIIKNYAPAAAVMAAGLGLSAGSVVLSEKKIREMGTQIAGLGAYIVGYRAKMKELNEFDVENSKNSGVTLLDPEEKDRVANEFGVMQKRFTTKESLVEAEQTPVSWWYDPFSDRWYKSTYAKHLEALIQIKEQFACSGFVSIGYWYDCLDESLNDDTKYDIYGWDVEWLAEECDIYWIPWSNEPKYNEEAGEWGFMSNFYWDPQNTYYVENGESVGKAMMRADRVYEMEENHGN